jgi:antitoxin ParD1/3/4
MNINFPPVDEDFIKSKVNDGYYSNATELVRDAVRRLRELDSNVHTRLNTSLNLGELDIMEGRVLRYSSELLNEIEEEAIIHAEKGGKINSDVRP